MHFYLTLKIFSAKKLLSKDFTWKLRLVLHWSKTNAKELKRIFLSAGKTEDGRSVDRRGQWFQRYQARRSGLNPSCGNYRKLLSKTESSRSSPSLLCLGLTCITVCRFSCCNLKIHKIFEIKRLYLLKN